MKKALLLLLIIIHFSCERQGTQFPTIECCKDGLKSNSNIGRVFKPCREFVFRARYWDSESNLISDEYIWMMATENGWEVQPELQTELIIQYQLDSTQIEFLTRNSVNPEIIWWTEKEVTGIIETEVKTWMHPFRSNQYIFTEVAPFPSVEFPLRVGKTWTSVLNIHHGWGKWTNSELLNTYQVIKYGNKKTKFRELSAWHIRGVTDAEFGKSIHNFWYNENYGFIEMNIENYEGQLLSIELINIIE